MYAACVYTWNVFVLCFATKRSSNFQSKEGPFGLQVCIYTHGPTNRYCLPVFSPTFNVEIRTRVSRQKIHQLDIVNRFISLCLFKVIFTFYYGKSQLKSLNRHLGYFFFSPTLSKSKIM